MDWKRKPKRKWKWLVSTVVIFTVLFASVLPAEAAGLDIGKGIGDAAGPNAGQKAMEDTENPGSVSSGNFTSDVHGHSWSVDWSCDESYHWHECDAGGCSVTVYSEMDGYGAHSYGDDDVCTECGRLKPAARPARAAAGAVPTVREAYEAMIALKGVYPEGMTWTNFTPYGSKGELGDSYIWKGGNIYGANRGVGCAAFAFILSDAAFGSLPARVTVRGSFTFEDVKVGDILRTEGNSHSVIVLQKSIGGVVIAEGNYNKSVHWGRVMSEAEVLAADYMITRYPEGYVPSDESVADKVVQSGESGSLSWSLTKAGILTISGSGMIPDYSEDQLPPWHEAGVSTIIIENGVTGIGDYAFYQNTALTIYIPDGIVRIGQNAFDQSALISVTIPGTAETIGNNAFHGCENLVSVTVSEGVKTIGDEAFRGCTSLSYIDFPASITSVGTGAFTSCKKMERVRFMPGSGKVTLGDNLFSQCWQLTSVTLPQTADCISAGMFQSCSSLPELYIPASVTRIGANSFASCGYLKSLYFGGTEEQWKTMMNPQLEGSLNSTGTTVIFNSVFQDPFAPDPDDPGDFWPEEDGKDPDDSNQGDSTHKHSWSENWSCDEACHWHECSAGCPVTDNRDKAGYGEHSYGSWVVDVNAAAFQNGSRHRDCTVCGYRRTDSIPAEGSSDDSNDNSGGSGGNTGNSGGNSGSTGENTGNLNNNSGSSGESGIGGGNDRLGGPDDRHGYAGQNGPVDTGNLPVAARSGRTETERNELPESGGNEGVSGGKSESADTESLTLQDQEETEAVSEESFEGEENEIQQLPDGETKEKDVNKSDKGSAKMIISVMSVLAGGALGTAFVFMRKKYNLKK